jgi:hypothetical protein
MRFWTNASEKMRIDSSGRVGIGITPYSWSTSFDNIQIGNKISLWNASNNGGLSYNQYYNGTNNIYQTNDTANRFQMDADGFHFYQAASGTAGNTATFSESMRITSTGNLGIGVTGPNEKLEVAGNTILGLGEDRPVKYDAGAGNFRITPNSGGFSTGYFFNISDGTFKGGLGALGSTGSLSYFWIGDDYNDATMVIKPNAGNVGIGTTTPAKKLEVVGTILSNTNGNRATGNINLGLTTNNVTKWSSITGTQYAHNTETEGFSIINGLSTSSLNAVYIGGALNEQNAATEIGFYTASNATTRTGSIKMKIVAGGNVGIGTTNPTGNLHISNTADAVLKIEGDTINSDETKGPKILLITDNGYRTAAITGGNATYETSSGNFNALNLQSKDIRFHTGTAQDYDLAVERMRITGTGALSFGTTGTAYGTSGQVLTSAGNASPTWTTPTTGTVTGTGVAGEVAYWTSSTNIANNAGMSFSNQQVQFDGIGGGDGFVLPYDENPGYSNMSAGGFGILFRETRDNYITGNAYWYKTGGTSSWRAKYSAYAATIIGSDGGNITFETAPANTTSPHTLTFSPKMVIKQGGNVGIGTTSPIAKLSVVGSDNTNQTSIGHSTQAVFIKVNGTNVDYNSSGNSSGSHTFSTGNVERMRITSGGNVGIGETTPLVPLHISRDSASGENIALLLDNNDTTAGSEIGMLFRCMTGSGNTDFEIFGKANAVNDFGS